MKRRGGEGEGGGGERSVEEGKGRREGGVEEGREGRRGEWG